MSALPAHNELPRQKKIVPVRVDKHVSPIFFNFLVCLSSGQENVPRKFQLLAPY